MDAFVSLDVHVAYNFDGGILGRDPVYLDVQNLTDAPPSFYNGTSKPSEVPSQAGENSFVSNPIGRLFSIGFRAKF